ncbi:hypothetical protein PFISCL1PPCAC_25369 [Pristionchus fissidentatus]|uniref:SXP/RAL-2 family protein Ani s 5-like cation-binding domain-containing protein n=1 Tax=Pristionchus fissidentatus TaxID=1538716 RepID=A0AAV5WPY0_9BILA|nr:hypothetical protein PFISCL1PPCAC_25369 [Pristionchus fissidentatus]
MHTVLILSALFLCASAHRGPCGSTLAPLTDAQKAEMKAQAQAKLATLSSEAQTAGNSILAAIEANEGNHEAVRTAIESILSGVSDSVKEELASILPAGGKHFGRHHGHTTPSA